MNENGDMLPKSTQNSASIIGEDDNISPRIACSYVRVILQTLR